MNAVVSGHVRGASLSAGREPITTRVLEKKHHARAYEKMVEEVSQGFQAFVVFALVNESDAENMERFKSAVEQYQRLSEKYPQVTFGLLHGQLTTEEKAAALEKFSRGGSDRILPLILSSNHTFFLS